MNSTVLQTDLYKVGRLMQLLLIELNCTSKLIVWKRLIFLFWQWLSPIVQQSFFNNKISKHNAVWFIVHFGCQLYDLCVFKAVISIKMSREPKTNSDSSNCSWEQKKTDCKCLLIATIRCLLQTNCFSRMFITHFLIC